MDNAVITTSNDSSIEDYKSIVETYISRSKADSTIKAYKSDWNDFVLWCMAARLTSLPSTPETVAAYVAHMVDQGRKYSTVARRIASISKAHQTAGFESPTRTALVRDTLTGVARTIGTAKKQAIPLRFSDIRKIVYGLDDRLQAKRDKGLLLLGWNLAARRSELVALDVNDVTFTDEGMRVALRRSKTDQSAEGVTFGINRCIKDKTLCPVCAVRDWITAADITFGPLFRAVNRHNHVQQFELNDKAVERIIRKYVPECDGHSLRSGFITDMYAVGTPEAVIAERSRHKSWSVLGSYRREANLFSYDYLDKVI